MKALLGIIVVAGLSAMTAGFIVSKRAAARHEGHLAEQHAAWQNEKLELESTLAASRAHPPESTTTTAATAASTADTRTAVPAKMTAEQIVAGLRSLKVGPGAPPRTIRQALSWFEDLIAAGPAALPALREFLAGGEDATFDPSVVLKSSRGAVPGSFVVPPTLRFGLLEAVKQIGGTGGERLLAETMNKTGRGVEVAWIARVLEEMAPGGYRDAALAAARELLARPPAPGSPPDRNDRDQLFSVLLMYGDAGYASTAQSQLIRPDGQLDPSTLDFLRQALGAQSVALAAQLYDDPRLGTPATKEPLARLALNFVGADAQANEFYYKAINDMTLTPGQRKNLIEDLNEDGFTDRKNLTARDLPLIENRMSLIEQVAPAATDSANIAAFKEAYKDLVNMRERVLRPPPTPAR